MFSRNGSLIHSALLVFLGINLSIISTISFAAQKNTPITKTTSTADHSKFEELKKIFKTGPEVTKACISCHTEASKQLHKTKHWNWQFTNPDNGEVVGKKTVVNNFCLSITSNLPRCTSCHIGYGWKDDSFDFTAQDKVDCLVCHDTTDTYKKFPTDAGHPNYKEKAFPKGSKKIWKVADLSNVAQKVGKTRRENCGVCHFYGGGGDGVKHGDLDSSMTNPDKNLDVHMGVDGLNFGCSECHTTDGHDVKGSRYNPVAKDTHGIDVPGRDDNSRATCESCHGVTPHESTLNNKINDHTDKVACVTCHLPTYARGGVPSKMWWDWTTAGKKDADGKHIKMKNEKGYVTYVTKKGNFEWAENVEPEYAWLSGDVRYKQLDEVINPDEVVELNTFAGSYDDPDARIWPFKVMRGKQPYDKGNNTLVLLHLFGKDKAAYWKSYDWDSAISAAMKEGGAEYSGEYGFIETSMHMPLAHMVPPKDQTLGCSDCHSKDGRLANLTDFYMPGRDNNKILDTIGWLAIAGTLGGVGLHGLVRVLFARKRRMKL
ncbi:MAG: tetrathionate reductase family octaheme c-type cytochrome [Gammaproteobacteria bacterium]|jgi:octaheme c-type cytochrome (tetrathionate reductase family)|nr:tetrathionate reductase family octaheme c-type cytochrome [Gammaproteobacteria bacterium]MBT3724160.1 tetrathionate reductase family octaheme c-type cytochrome [Gammaproteobacteria bacterium]MBT4076592.1 tetrathionate reductase family octaheme c-type cytochrome [Gammaproteobacteria bacterium]MBT4194749.1 tetrathionate reductase family octaheme c-type cytochrome [Gammaproteobacteria bacterium]MBT4450394.1 tetrathionate reductase family octaheme c-type cytochrome [Gammaproteobacteria bacterium